VLDLRRLQALRAVVETGSVTAAAAQIGYTPSAISQHVATLERETGTVLLERAGRGVRPTAAGRILADHAVAVLERAAEAEAALAALRAGEQGVLRTASFATAGAALVPPALAALRVRLPALELDLRVVERDEALHLLRQGEVDLAIVIASTGPDDVRDRRLVWTELLDDPFRLVLPRDHRLARRRTIRLSELAEETWVDTCGVGGCHEVTDPYFGRAGFVPRRAIEADEYSSAQGFVAAGIGISLIPTLALGAVHDGVVVRKLHREAEPVRRIRAATRQPVASHLPIATMLAALKDAAAAHQRCNLAPAGEDARNVSGARRS